MYLLLSYIKYWLLRSEEHSIHSPFVFKFYTEVVKASHNLDTEIEALRQELKTNSNKLNLKDYGAGSIHNVGNVRSVRSIARQASTPPRFSSFLSKLIDYFNYQNIIELGTSLGLNTLYLSKHKNVQVRTFEGDPSLCSIARENLLKFDIKNAEVIEGNINDTLPDYLRGESQIDLVYIDANHRYAPTLSYFDLCLPKMSEYGVIVLDDIHWSKEMWRAWTEIKMHPSSILTIDLFEAGLVFLNPDLQKGDYILKF